MSLDALQEARAGPQKRANSGRKSRSWVQSCSLDSHFSFSHFQMSTVPKGQCLTEQSFLQINAACKIKADNHLTRETRSWSMTVHISAQASAMTCDAMSNSCFGTESRALRSAWQSQQVKAFLLIDIQYNRNTYKVQNFFRSCGYARTSC